RLVRPRRAHLTAAALDLQRLARPLQAHERNLVEALVVEAADVAHKPRLERGLWCRSAARYEARGRAKRNRKGSQPKRQQSSLAQKILPPPRDPSHSEAMLLPAASAFS